MGEQRGSGVWGQMVTGGGHAHLMTVMGVPVMTKEAFIATEISAGCSHLRSQ